MQDKNLVKEIHKVMNEEISENFSITQDGMLTLRGRICVLDVDDLKM